MARAMRINDPDHLMADEQVIVEPCGVHGSVITQFRVGAPEPDGISRQGNPAEARLVAARTLPIRRDAHVGPRASRGEIIGPQERREAGVDGSGTAIRGYVPGIVIFLVLF